MRRSVVASVAVIAVVLSVPVAPAVGASAAVPVAAESVAAVQPPSETANATATAPRMVAVYPNPVRDGDRGEFVVLDLPPGNWTLDDGEARVRLPNATGRVAVSPHPDAVRPWVDVPVHRVPDDLALANGGEVLRLQRGDWVADRTQYENAPERERWVRSGRGSPCLDRPAGVACLGAGVDLPGVGRDGWRWEPLGATDIGVAASGPASATAFVLPDAPTVPRRVLADADRRLFLAAYTFASNRTADRLLAAADRGVDVRVLVEGAPVGGVSRTQVRLLDRLAAGGVDVRVVGGPRARYAHHHAKYAVVDDRALVLTENWKPSGVGGASNRGWGVAVNDTATADALAGVFRRDHGWRGTVPWRDYRRTVDARRDPPVDGTYRGRIAPERVRVDRVRLAVTPDNAERTVIGALRRAEESVAVLQASVDPESSFWRETVRAAERGVRVRVILSGAWYVREENAAKVERLNERAERASLPIEAKLAEGGDRFGALHAKGAVIDRERVIVGSLNWNPHAARENREVVLVLDGPVAGYYADAFDADWSGGGTGLPIGFVGVVLAAVAVAAWVVRRVVVRAEGDPAVENRY